MCVGVRAKILYSSFRCILSSLDCLKSFFSEEDKEEGEQNKSKGSHFAGIEKAMIISHTYDFFCEVISFLYSLGIF